ncbi:MAG: hypothetical protein MK085_08785 [Phycisphaerales bacterium]|nr:hypothetical protein [Phycisphaerales bacterium]
MTPVLRWIKSHLVIVICAIVVIGAPVTAWFVSDGMNTELREDISRSSSRIGDLDRLKKSSVRLEVPGGQPVQLTTVINPTLLEAYEKAVLKIGGESDRVHKAGLVRNRQLNGVDRDKDDIIQGMFPAPKATEAQTLPFEMYEALIEKYEQLLEDVNASGPPAVRTIEESLTKRRDRFVTGQRKDSVADLDDSEHEDLSKELVSARLNLYRSYVLGESTFDGGRDKPIRFYATLDDLDLPGRPSKEPPLAELFDWQWRYWIAQDLLHALADANGTRTPLDGPVKRLVGMKVSPLNLERESKGGQGGGMGMGGMGMNMGGGGQGRRGNNSRGGNAPGGNSPSTDPGKPNIDPSREAKIDYGISLSGRVSNDVYDVRLIDCELIVATAGLPEVMDAIAKRNFMTVLNARIRPADAFEAAKNGFIYGIEPVSRVTLKIESVWLREWTAEAMPGDLREVLGIKSTPAGNTG